MLPVFFELLFSFGGSPASAGRFFFFFVVVEYCRSHSKCPCGAPGAPGFLGAVFFCSCLIKGESRVHNLAICSFFWGSVVVWVLMGGEGGEKDVDCPIGW